MPRLFIAVDLPEPLRASLAAQRPELRGVRWVPSAQIHLTLRFLAQQSEQMAVRIRCALEAVRAPAFPLCLHGVGVFPRAPSRRNPARVLWVGVDPESAVVGLKAAIDAALGPVLGPDPESAARGFSPHVTLARFKQDPGAALDRFLAEQQLLRGEAFAVSAFHLYGSDTRPEGAVHSVLASYPLPR